MQQLRVTNFSSISSAEMEIADLTVLIGPQASGKSVLSKLIYFFNQIIITLPIVAEDRLTLEELGDKIKEDFEKWFPSAAWGERVFHIRFEAGPFSFHIKRKGSTSRLSNKIEINFSADFLSHYDVLEVNFENAVAGDKDQNELSVTRPWRVLNLIAREQERLLHEILDQDYVSSQIFVPAGRSWFSSIGKAIGAFEYSGLLDPITLDFGRLYTSARERARDTWRTRGYSPIQRRLMHDLFGGEVRFERDKEFVQTADGRKLPFGVLSSGQQELLPLWLVISQLPSFPAVRRERRGKSLIFIEEPEAHLFPSGQSLLLDYLARTVSRAVDNRQMLITTHSPYVLSKINNLLKAGSLGYQEDRPELAEEIMKIVPKRSWLRASEAAAYAIIDGQVVPIMNDEGLIDGDYLDEVSGEISRTFNRLLELEFADD